VVPREPFFQDLVLQRELAAKTLQLSDSGLQSFFSGGRLLVGEGLFAASLVLLAPLQENTLREIVLAAELGGALLASGYLPATLQF
jgi:hypothetical protein